MHYWDLRGQPGSFSVLSWHIPRTTMRADEITRVLAAQVARLRKAAGWSQAQLAERVAKHRPGWTRSSVTKLENGLRESISVGDLVALALAFDVPPVMLLADPRSVDEVPLAKGVTVSAWDALLWFTGDALAGRDLPGNRTVGPYEDAAAVIRAARELPSAIREVLWYVHPNDPDNAAQVEAVRKHNDRRHREALQTIATGVHLLNVAGAPLPRCRLT